MTEPVVRAHTDVTPAFLTEVLGAAGWIGDAVVVAAPAERIGDGLMGVCARYRLQLDRAVPDAPRSVVGKFAAEDATAREFMAASGYRNDRWSWGRPGTYVARASARLEEWPWPERRTTAGD